MEYKSCTSWEQVRCPACMGSDFDPVDCFNSKPYDPFKISCNRCGFIMDFAGGVAPYAEVGVLRTANQAK